MSLMYIARLTRPDILFATVYLSTKSARPTRTNYKAACRVLKYLTEAGPNYKIVYRHSAHLVLNIYADSSHCLHPDGKGQAGIMVCLGDSLIHARTSKIKMTTLSSTESESVVLCEAATYVHWLKVQMGGSTRSTCGRTIRQPRD